MEKLFDLSKKEHQLTAILACVDSVLGSHNGISELWFQNPIGIGKYKALPDKHDDNEGEQSSFSVATPIKLDKNWKNDTQDTRLDINLQGSSVNHTLSLQLANTLFQNCESSTCFFLQPGKHPDNWMNLQQLSLTLPCEELDANNLKFVGSNNLKELHLGSEDKPLQVTKYTSNMIDEIDDRPAAEYLINNKEIQKSKRPIFMELISQSHPEKGVPFSTIDYTNEFYQIVVGGLGWGEKQGMIALDPTVGEIGYRYCRLFQQRKYVSHKVRNVPDKITICAECSEPEKDFEDYNIRDDAGSAEIILDNVTGLGSEHGFSFDRVWHKAAGDELDMTKN